MLNLPPNIIGNSKDETNFPHKLILSDIQVARLHQAFVNNSSANIKLSKTQLLKLEGFLGRFFGLLMKVDIPLMKNVLTPLAKSVLTLLGLRELASASEPTITDNFTDNLKRRNEIYHKNSYISSKTRFIDKKVSVKQVTMKQNKKKMDFLVSY